jgi:putative peptidoglycan lipid II flippase
MAIQWPQVRRLHFRHTWSFNWHFPGVIRLFRLMPARLLTIGISEFQNLALGFFATQIGDLSFVILNYATSIITLPVRFFGVPIAQATLPFLSEQADEHDRETFRMMIVHSLNQVSFLAVPAAALILILRIPIVRLIYGSRNFPWETTVTMGRVVAILAIAIAVRAFLPLLTRGFHALRNTLTPFLISLITTLLFFGGCIFTTFTSHINHLYGVAITISAVAFLEAGLSLLFLHRLSHRIIRRGLIYPQLKIFAAGLLMAIALYLPFKLLDRLVFDTTRVLPLIALTFVTAIIGFAVYIGFCALLRLRELRLLTRAVNFLRRRRFSVGQLPATESLTEPISEPTIS